MTEENTTTGQPPVVTGTDPKEPARRGRPPKAPKAPKVATERSRPKHDFILQIKHVITLDGKEVAAWVDIPETTVKDTSDGLRVMTKLPVDNRYRVIYIGAEREVKEETRKVVTLV